MKKNVASPHPHLIPMFFFWFFLEVILHSNLATQLDEKVPSTSEDEALFAPNMTCLKKMQPLSDIAAELGLTALVVVLKTAGGSNLK